MVQLDSKLVSTRNWKIQFRTAIRAMEARYLTDGAEMELNIDYNLKRKMNKLADQQRHCDVMRTLQAICKEICKLLDGAFVDFNASVIAEAYYKKQKVRESTFFPQVSISHVSKVVALWNTEQAAS